MVVVCAVLFKNHAISSSTQRNNGTNKNAISKALYEHTSYAQHLRFAVTTSKVQAVRTRAVAVNLGKLKGESDGAFTSHFATPSPGYVMPSCGRCSASCSTAQERATHVSILFVPEQVCAALFYPQDQYPEDWHSAYAPSTAKRILPPESPQSHHQVKARYQCIRAHNGSHSPPSSHLTPLRAKLPRRQ